jgi:hypothetical protein
MMLPEQAGSTQPLKQMAQVWATKKPSISSFQTM